MVHVLASSEKDIEDYLSVESAICNLQSADLLLIFSVTATAFCRISMLLA